MLLLECVPDSLTKEIMSELKIPVIGIGAGIFN
jgi:ketopantoate hydroxymethyltransferase